MMNDAPLALVLAENWNICRDHADDVWPVHRHFAE